MLDLLIMGHIQAPKGIDDFGHFQNLTCALDSQELSDAIQLEICFESRNFEAGSRASLLETFCV